MAEEQMVRMVNIPDDGVGVQVGFSKGNGDKILSCGEENGQLVIYIKSKIALFNNVVSPLVKAVASGENFSFNMVYIGTVNSTTHGVKHLVHDPY